MLQSHRSIFDPGIPHKNCLTNFVHRSGMVIPLPLYRVQLLGMVIPRTASIVPLPLYRFQHKPQIPQKKMFDKPMKAVYHTSMKKNKLRNSLTVRLTDKDHDDFIKISGRQYSTTLRTLIKEHINENQADERRRSDSDRAD